MPGDPRLLPMAPPGSGAPPVFERIAIVGLGLIGGSLALACRKQWPSALVIGVDEVATLETAVSRHAVDVASEDLMIVSEADLVVLAAPVHENIAVVGRLADCVRGAAVVTDVGETKRGIAAAAQSLPERLRFVGGHPLAGVATGAIEAARADLFRARPWFLAPAAPGAEEALQRLLAFVEAIGARPHVLESLSAFESAALRNDRSPSAES